MKPKYRPISVSVELEDQRRGSWVWHGHKITGTDFIYRVFDANLDRLNKWVFSVCVPNNPGRIIVQPQVVPGTKVLAPVAKVHYVSTGDQASFPQVHLLQGASRRPEFEEELDRDDPRRSKQAPRRFAYFGSRMRLKETVTRVNGNDGGIK